MKGRTKIISDYCHMNYGGYWIKFGDEELT